MSLTLSNVSKSFGERVLFRDVSLHLGGRARVALVGPNGAGKTTLLEIIAGEQDADTGTVTVGKDEVVGYLKQEAIEMAGRTRAAGGAHGRRRRHLARAPDRACSRPTSPRRSDERRARADAREYGRLRERFEHLGRLHARGGGAQRC